jgi:hypothetical protein
VGRIRIAPNGAVAGIGKPAYCRAVQSRYKSTTGGYSPCFSRPFCNSHTEVARRAKNHCGFIGLSDYHQILIGNQAGRRFLRAEPRKFVFVKFGYKTGHRPGALALIAAAADWPDRAVPV